MIEFIDILTTLLRASIILISALGAYKVLLQGHLLRAWMLVTLTLLEIMFISGLNGFVPIDYTRIVFLSLLLITAVILGFTDSYFKWETKFEKILKEKKIL